ncbi:MAG: hypothetical protein MJY89_06285 [Bacteroidales bacterium]|nr:hypothetical protein [Bacteroidales bacterium]
MSTNYMTVNESETDKLNARLWRIKQAIDHSDKDFGCPALDKKIMELRYKVTKQLRDILIMQNYVWEGASDEEYEAWNKECPDPEKLLEELGFDRIPVDEELAEGQYKDELDFCDHLGPDRAYLDIYNPMNWWNDLSYVRRKELNDEAKRELENFRKSDSIKGK